MPPRMKKNSDAAPYMMPMRLWSTVVNQLFQPVVDFGRVKTPMGARSTAPLPDPSASGCSTVVSGPYSRSCVQRSSFDLGCGDDCVGRLRSEGDQELDEVVDLVLGQVEVGHATTQR